MLGRPRVCRAATALPLATVGGDDCPTAAAAAGVLSRAQCCCRRHAVVRPSNMTKGSCSYARLCKLCGCEAAASGSCSLPQVRPSLQETIPSCVPPTCVIDRSSALSTISPPRSRATMSPRMFCSRWWICCCRTTCTGQTYACVSHVSASAQVHSVPCLSGMCLHTPLSKWPTAAACSCIHSSTALHHQLQGMRLGDTLGTCCCCWPHSCTAALLALCDLIM